MLDNLERFQYVQQQQPSLLVPSKLEQARNETHRQRKTETKTKVKSKGNKKPNKKG
jgi:hypothetical protein